MARPVFGTVPLRLKLIAAVLALVTIALVLIGVVSALALRTYLVDRIDRQLVDIADSVDVNKAPQPWGERSLPSDYAVAFVRGSVIDLMINRPASSYPVIPVGDHIRNLENRSITVPSRSSAERWRLLIRPQRDGVYLVVGESLSGADDAVDRLVAAELIVGIGVLAVLTSVGIGIVQASLRPLTEIEQTAEAIAAGDLARRVPESDPNTEVGHLANAFNAMLVQIEGAFAARAMSEERMRQFVADASHELRTPLTTIRGFAELYRQGAARAPAETAALLERVEGEAARMGLLVEDLLQLARLDQARPLTLAPVELRALASDAVTAARAVDPDREITLTTGDESVLVIGDEPRLRQVIGNLMTNALTHTPTGTPVTVRVRREHTTAIIEVSDAGPGLTRDQQLRVFERFYRVDKARTRRAAGTAQAVAPHSG
ncbi:MAG: HAMP domain-containing histidine kinase, partial [Dactylosporangium sp.]|nr:HAMP domain-containing histidine kinase [Dactylosporangium sp.]NNJ63688.1 HAMP domain-containing histidine kinase [Dactylosporangium sp.]